MMLLEFKKILLLVSMFSTFGMYSQNQFQVSEVIVPRKIEFKGKSLDLNGAGGRWKFWSEIYVQALYLSQLSQDPEFIINSDTEMAVRIEITSSMVSLKRFVKALNNGFQKSDKKKLDNLRSRIVNLKTLVSGSPIKNGDVFLLVYNPLDQTINILKNDIFLGKIAGFDFKQALFGIWLSDDPVNEELKDNLLGRRRIIRRR